MIYGYPARASLASGEALVLRVSTDASRFCVRFYRCGDGLTPVHETGWLRGRLAAPGHADADWQWPPYRIAIPADWPSAVYIAHLWEDGGAPLSLALTSAAVLFVVRGSGRAGMLYKLPLATYHAYNTSGGACFYDKPPRSHAPPGARLSFQRPGGGIGGATFGATDVYDRASPRQTFAHWDAPFIAWLVRNGYQPEFCIDLDLQAHPALLNRHRLLLSVGHDEYWSSAMRSRVEAFVDAGGNAAFFSANVCWWRIHLVDNGQAMVCHQGGPVGALDRWHERPEDSLTGLSYRHGGGSWDGPRTSTGYIVQDGDHWAFEGTGLATGDVLGRDSTPPLVGYECDGAPLASFDDGCARLCPDAARSGTPSSLRLLAACALGADWQERPSRPDQRQDIHAACMSVFTRGGTVFSAGTTDWSQVLASGEDAQVERITHNVLRRLLAVDARHA